MEPVSAPQAAPWPVRRVIGHVLLVGVVFLTAQVLGLIVLLVARSMFDPGFEMDAWADQIESDGGVVVAATWGSALICVPFVAWLAKRREGAPWKFLRIQPVSLEICVKWVGAIVVLVAITDLMTLWLDGEVVADFQVQWYASTSPLLLFLAMVVAAPLFEEVFFRGYLLSALERAGLPMIVAAAISAALWASIHLQYDLYFMSIIFVMGLLLAAARTRTGSVIPCIAMHAVANAIAFVETAYVAVAAV